MTATCTDADIADCLAALSGQLALQLEAIDAVADRLGLGIRPVETVNGPTYREAFR